MRDSGVSWRAKVVGYTLSTYMNGSGRAYPSRATLATGASVSQRTVDKATVELATCGFLVIDKSRGRTANTYLAALPATAHDVRRWEWDNSAPQDTNSAPRASNSARRAPESVGKRSESVSSSKKRKGRISDAAHNLAYLDEDGSNE